MAGRNPHRGEDDPHGGQPVGTAGTPLDDAAAAVVLVHGRGATAESMLQMAGEFETDGVAYLAPQARGRTWYPHSFLEPVERNEPSLSSALELVGEVLARVGEAGVPFERTAVVGFSQGACLSSEYVARNVRRYGGLAALSGGLVGPDDASRDYDGDLDGTPVFLGCSDVDPHVPLERVHGSRDVFERLGGDVTERVYEEMAHTVNDDEIVFLRDLLQTLVEQKPTPSDSDPDGGDDQ